MFIIIVIVISLATANALLTPSLTAIHTINTCSHYQLVVLVLSLWLLVLLVLLYYD